MTLDDVATILGVKVVKHSLKDRDLGFAAFGFLGCYSPPSHSIHLIEPSNEIFAHELIHATAKFDNRKLDRKGEERVARIGGYMLLKRINISFNRRHKALLCARKKDDCYWIAWLAGADNERLSVFLAVLFVGSLISLVSGIIARLRLD